MSEANEIRSPAADKTAIAIPKMPKNTPSIPPPAKTPNTIPIKATVAGNIDMRFNALGRSRRCGGITFYPPRIVSGWHVPWHCVLASLFVVGNLFVIGFVPTYMPEMADVHIQAFEADAGGFAPARIDLTNKYTFKRTKSHSVDLTHFSPLVANKLMILPSKPGALFFLYQPDYQPTKMAKQKRRKFPHIQTILCYQLNDL